MPRLSQAKKDVISCDKPRVGANNHRFADFRMGQPVILKICHTLYGKQTQGTETSKYLQEKKTTVIPPVAASDRGIAQTVRVSARTG